MRGFPNPLLDSSSVSSGFAEANFSCGDVDFSLLCFEGGAADLLCPERRDERGQDVLLKPIPKETLLTEFRMDLIGEGGVECRELGPVKARVLVVGRVVAVVEEEEIEDFPLEIP